MTVGRGFLQREGNQFVQASGFIK